MVEGDNTQLRSTFSLKMCVWIIKHPPTARLSASDQAEVIHCRHKVISSQDCSAFPTKLPLKTICGDVLNAAVFGMTASWQLCSTYIWIEFNIWPKCRKNNLKNWQIIVFFHIGLHRGVAYTNNGLWIKLRNVLVCTSQLESILFKSASLSEVPKKPHSHTQIKHMNTRTRLLVVVIRS